MVTIDLSQLPAKQVDVSKYVDDVFVVPLETTPGSLFGQLSQIDQDDSDIFYLSRENQTIYQFSAGGKFINSFCRNRITGWKSLVYLVLGLHEYDIVIKSNS